MRVTKKALLSCVGVITAIGLVGCAPTEDSASTETTDADTSEESGSEETEDGAATASEQVTVGLITSETGALASYGEQYLHGFEAGLDYITDGTNIVGDTEIIVEVRDDGGDADKAVTAAKELIGSGVQILAGTASSGVALSVAEQAAQTRCSTSPAPPRPTPSPA